MLRLQAKLEKAEQERSCDKTNALDRVSFLSDSMTELKVLCRPDDATGVDVPTS